MISLWAFFLERWDIRSEDSDHNGCLSQSWLCLWWCEKNKLGQNKTYILLQLITLYWPMLKLDRKEDWAPKNWCFWTVVLEKTLESPLGSKEIKPVNRKGNQPWIFTGRIDDEAEVPILWPPDAKNWLTGNTLMLGKIEGRRRRGQWRMRWLDGIINSMDIWVWANSGR